MPPPGKKPIINRGPRVNVEDTQKIIDKIPALSGLFTRLQQKFDEQEAADREELEKPESQETTAGLVYLSRLQAGTWGAVKNIKDYDEAHNPFVKGDDHDDSTSGVGGGAGGVGSMSAEEGQQRGGTAPGIAADNSIARSLSSQENLVKLKKRRRIALSLATLASKPEKHESIIKEGAIMAIGELSVIQDVIVQKACSSAFSLLAAQPHLRHRMHDEQALGHILNLSMTPNKIVRVECCKALTNLMCEAGYESRAVRDGVPYTLMKIVPEMMNEVEIVLTCLVNLTCVSDKYARVEEVTDALMQLSLKRLSTSQESLIIKGLANLSALKSFQQRLLEDGCMPILEKAMKVAPAPDRVLAAMVVRNLTTCYRTRSKLLDHNIIAMLVSMSRDSLEEVKGFAVKALYNLSRDGACRERIVGGNAVTVILKISRETGGNIAIGRLAAKTLRVLCGDASVANKLVGDGIVKALMSLLRNDDTSIQQYCAESICSLFQIDAVLGKLVDQGAVGVIVSLSQSSTEFITGEWCSFALYYLATNEQCPEDTLQQAILPCLIKLCQYSSSRTKYFCSSAFAYTTLLKDIDTAEAIPTLVRMLLEEEDVQTKNNCITSLYNSADVDENCCSMLECGVLQPLLDLTRSENVQTRIECAAILCRLSLQVSFYPEFEELNVQKILLELSSIEHTLTQRRVIIGLSNLSANKRLRRQLFGLNPIPYIIPLAAKRDENLRRGCVSIVCNLASEMGTEQQIVEAGIVETLLITAMISSDQLQTKVICVKALINLMADETQYTAMVKAGVVWSFSVLATQPDAELLQMCARALCCLSVRFADKMLESNAVVKTAMLLIQQVDDLELQRIGGRCLSNLMLAHREKGYEQKDVEFRAHVCAKMHPLAENGDDECSEMCISILCTLSAFDDSKEAIVSSGMLRKLDSGLLSSPTLSGAYLTMFGNIASDVNMRTKILNDRTIEKFQSMCFIEDPKIDLTVVKTVYSLTCSSENLPLIAENVVPLLYQIWSADHEKDPQLLSYVLSILYNVTTAPDVQYKLVSHGVVDFISQDLWPHAVKQTRLLHVACNTIMHLGCGNVNTSRLVDDKATGIYAFITDPKNRAKFSFAYNDLYRVSACLRNMLCHQSNHKSMVSQGCIRALMAIANEAEKTSHIQDPITELCQLNCQSALRSLTYNVDVRDVLIEQGAIDFIMAELTKEDTSIKYELLVEVEAESWSNGARGTNRDGRSPTIAPDALDTHLLEFAASRVAAVLTEDGEIEAKATATATSSANIENSASVGQAEGVHLQKYHVKVVLDEPEIEASSYNKALKFGINDLETIIDPEENALPVTCLCPKTTCKVEPYSLWLLKQTAGHTEDDDADHYTNVEEEQEQQQNSSSSGNNNLPDLAKSAPGMASSAALPRSAGATGGSMLPAIAGTSNDSPPDGNQLAAGSSMSWGNGESQVLYKDGGGGAAAAAVDGTGGRATGTNGRRTRRGAKPETPGDRFDKLVGLIKASKKSKGALVEQVVDNWNAISRF